MSLLSTLFPLVQLCNDVIDVYPLAPLCTDVINVCLPPCPLPSCVMMSSMSVSTPLPLAQLCNVIINVCLPPREKWKRAFGPRDLLALSVDPFLVYPTHFTGEPNYISDTEDSIVVDEANAKMTKEEL